MACCHIILMFIMEVEVGIKSKQCFGALYPAHSSDTSLGHFQIASLRLMSDHSHWHFVTVTLR